VRKTVAICPVALILLCFSMPAYAYDATSLKGSATCLMENTTVQVTDLFTFDGSGNVTAKEFLPYLQVLCQYSAAGTYSISSDGTGTAPVTFTDVTPGGCPLGVSSYSDTLELIIGHNGILLTRTTRNAGEMICTRR